jgi:hypothetical protein
LQLPEALAERAAFDRVHCLGERVRSTHASPNPRATRAGSGAFADIYHWEPNANSGKPILAAFEKGVEFESRYIDMLGFEQHASEYLKVNPNGTIPGMVHDGVLVPESTVMMEYIDASFEGPPLRPSDPFERWRMR